MTIQNFVEGQQLNTNWLTIEYDGWRLPATSKPHDWCDKDNIHKEMRVKVKEMLSETDLEYETIQDIAAKVVDIIKANECD
ncbi:MAG: hypothetical protein LDL06_05230, partial [Candidatus Nitrosotenuis sp.]|nr:hypothetical protein [Candidatus Nitrosotenuis sp.]